LPHRHSDVALCRLLWHPALPHLDTCETSHYTGIPFADDIYREDVVFKDPRNVVRGKKNYKRIFKVKMILPLSEVV
jgi:hypothetical protein